MEERAHLKRRYLAVVAATCVSLACGTNYGFSAWAPQFAKELQLSATQTNLIVSNSYLRGFTLTVYRVLQETWACTPWVYL
jgi:hypothetical protein